jgi:hypothetical protein
MFLISSNYWPCKPGHHFSVILQWPLLGRGGFNKVPENQRLEWIDKEENKIRQRSSSFGVVKSGQWPTLLRGNMLGSSVFRRNFGIHLQDCGVITQNEFSHVCFRPLISTLIENCDLKKVEHMRMHSILPIYTVVSTLSRKVYHLSGKRGYSRNVICFLCGFRNIVIREMYFIAQTSIYYIDSDTITL